MSIQDDPAFLKRRLKELDESLARAQASERAAVERAKMAEQSAARAWSLVDRSWGSTRRTEP